MRGWGAGLWLLILGAGLPAAAMAAPKPAVTYTVSPRLDGEALSGVVVSMDLRADSSGVTRLDLPDQWMGQKEGWRRISDLTVGGAVSVTEDGPAARVIRSAPGHRLSVRYVVNSALDREPRESDGYPARPWVRPSWFYLDGAGVFATVHGREDETPRFRWGAWPKGFALASNLEQPEAKPVGHSTLIGGRDVRVVTAGPLRLAVHGALGVSDADLAHDLNMILRAERGFFGDPQDAPYLVTAAGLPSETGGYFTGVGKLDAFAMVATANMTADDLRILLAHEIFHSWNPGRLGQPIGPRGYWFSEGFTDFYARRLLLRERLITPDAFIKVWNQALRTYGASPAKLTPGDKAADAFWTDPDAERMLYLRGAMLAALWDRKLRQQGSSLDEVLRAQAKASAARPGAGLIELFVEQAKAHGLDVTADIAAHVEEGGALELPADVFAPCADLVTMTTPSFDLGFEPRMGADGQMVVSGLRQDSAAYRAGLREGMTVVEKVRGTNGDAAQLYELRVRAGGGAVQIMSFLPTGSGTVTYQQLAPRSGANGACDFR